MVKSHGTAPIEVNFDTVHHMHTHCGIMPIATDIVSYGFYFFKLRVLRRGQKI